MNIDQIRAKYNPATDDECFILKRIFRPLSFWLTWLYMRIGIKSADTVNLIGLCMGVGALALIATVWLKLGVMLYLLYLINDQCDGNIARATETTSYRGKFMDGSIDVFVDGLLPLAVVIGTQAPLFIGVGVTVIVLYAAFLLNRFSFFSMWIEAQTGKGHINPIKRVTALRNLEMNFRIICLCVFLPGVLIGMGVWFTALTISLLIQSYRLDVPKVSRMAWYEHEEIRDFMEVNK